MSNNEDLKEILIKELFVDEKYIIPIYQRNYAWGKKEIEQLINDINDYVKDNNLKNNYYIGSLIVHNRNDNKLEVIDGQQRLTTLFILLNVLKIQKTLQNNLIFESRIKSTNALKKISSDEYVDEDLNFHIIEAQKIIQKKLNSKDIDNKKFLEYLLNQVIILQIKVPLDTDLNHYFEIMNNRGEQLEKHEILKSRLLNILKDDKNAINIFNQIWEACSNMERYVQYGFSNEKRSTIFGDNWNEFKADSFDVIGVENKSDNSKITENKEEQVKPTLENIIYDRYININDNNNIKSLKDTPERFTSVINFPNFLLHVIKLQVKKDIPLDDKKLLEVFKENIKSVKDVKKFAFNLLKIRFLFDNYIIKKDFSKELDGTWSLLQLCKNNKESKNNTAYYKNRFENDNDKTKNEHISVLLSMFHVSAPTLVYKHWLNANLKYLLDSKDSINGNSYINYLEKLAKVYMKDRYLNDNIRSYHEIIYSDKLYSQNLNLNYKNLNNGTNVENFIFNYLDYLLWKKNDNYKSFKFTFKTSVEHYYPQHPMENIDPLDDNILNCFGNLCLISNSENSRLSNFTPQAKKDFYTKQQNNSLKQNIMMHYKEWTKKEILCHHKKMIKILKESLK